MDRYSKFLRPGSIRSVSQSPVIRISKEKSEKGQRFAINDSDNFRYLSSELSTINHIGKTQRETFATWLSSEIRFMKRSVSHPAFRAFLEAYYRSAELNETIRMEKEALVIFQSTLDRIDQACRYAYAMNLWSEVDKEVQLSKLPKSGIADSQLQKVLDTTEKAGWRPDDAPPTGVTVKQ